MPVIAGDVGRLVPMERSVQTVNARSLARKEPPIVLGPAWIHKIMHSTVALAGWLVPRVYRAFWANASWFAWVEPRIAEEPAWIRSLRASTVVFVEKLVLWA